MIPRGGEGGGQTASASASAPPRMARPHPHRHSRRGDVRLVMCCVPPRRGVCAGRRAGRHGAHHKRVRRLRRTRPRRVAVRPDGRRVRVLQRVVHEHGRGAGDLPAQKNKTFGVSESCFLGSAPPHRVSTGQNAMHGNTRTPITCSCPVRRAEETCECGSHPRNRAAIQLCGCDGPLHILLRRRARRRLQEEAHA